MFIGKGLRVFSILLFVLLSAGAVSAQCVADGNDSAKTASSIQLLWTGADWVCPDDPWDYMVLEIPASLTGYSGTITFNALETGTTLDITSPTLATPFFARKGTTDKQKDFEIKVASGDMPAGIYYFRIGFYSSYQKTHGYSLDVALTESLCKPDSNNSPENAWTILWEDSATDFVCADDPIDIWKINIADESQGQGTIGIEGDNGWVMAYLYDSKNNELFKLNTKNGPGKFNLGGLPPGDYYIGIQFPQNGINTAYTITTTPGEIKIPEGTGIISGVGTITTPDIGAIMTGAPGIFVRVVVDSLFCMVESANDELSNSDEPYPVFEVRTKSMSGEELQGTWFHEFDDVDALESRKISWENRKVYEGTIPYGVALEIVVDLYEQDTGGNDTIGDQVVNRIEPDILHAWSMSENNRRFEAVFYGGDEGRYAIRYHLEFKENSSIRLPIKFNNYDQLVLGDFHPGAGDEFLIVSDDPPGNVGLFSFYNGNGGLIKSFEKPFTAFDPVVSADADGDGLDEIIVGDNLGDKIRAYDIDGNLKKDFPAAIGKYDGFGAIDATADGKCEYYIASADEDKVYTYESSGKLFGWTDLAFNFTGVRKTGSDTRNDAFLVGDVYGNSELDFLFIKCKLGPDSEIFVYDTISNVVSHHVRYVSDLAVEGLSYSEYDAVSLCDVNGDGRQELLIASDEGDGYAGLLISAVDLVLNSRIASYSWPMFTPYDGFAVGDVLNLGTDQMLIASDDDQCVYITLQ